MNKIGGKIILWLLILCMLGFTTSRTLDFLKRTLPPDQGYIAYIALAAFGIGLLGWFYFATQSAEGEAQRAIAYGMIFVCAAGEIVTTICDLILVSAANGTSISPDPQIGTIAVWVVSLVITINVVGGIVVHLVDPKHQRHMATERAKQTIFTSSLAAIEKRAGEMAPRIATLSADYWEQKITEELIGSIPGIKKIAERTVEGSISEPVALAQTTEPLKKKVRALPKTKRAASTTAQP